MIDWTRIVGFDWDAGNARKSSEKHGVGQAEAEQAFFNQPLLILADPRHSRRETRFHALGITDEKRQLHISFTLRRRPAESFLIRVISARDMHRKERQRYAQAEKNS
ncbi:MAG: BrnT family toxin [Woeseia sp.]